MSEFPIIEAGTEVFVIEPPLNWGSSTAEFSSVKSETVHKQHKTGKIALRAGRDAKKYGPLRYAGSARSHGAPWMYEELGTKYPDYIIPKTAEARAWVLDNIRIIEAETAALACAKAIEKNLTKSMRSGEWLLANADALRDAAHGLGFLPAKDAGE